VQLVLLRQQAHLMCIKYLMYMPDEGVPVQQTAPAADAPHVYEVSDVYMYTGRAGARGIRVQQTAPRPRGAVPHRIPEGGRGADAASRGPEGGVFVCLCVCVCVCVCVCGLPLFLSLSFSLWTRRWSVFVCVCVRVVSLSFCLSLFLSGPEGGVCVCVSARVWSPSLSISLFFSLSRFLSLFSSFSHPLDPLLHPSCV
jgi:hypothetical protein